eukprot:6172440-Lingulodinium_polyedra.AAC.1
MCNTWPPKWQATPPTPRVRVHCRPDRARSAQGNDTPAHNFTRCNGPDRVQKQHAKVHCTDE